jgi:hypothetical protein
LTGVLGVVGQLLPVALAPALSSVPIPVMILIMLSPRRKVAAVPFMIGIVIGAAVVVGGATLLAQTLPPARVRHAEPVVGVIEILVGLALVVLAVRAWRRRNRSGRGLRPPRWAAAVDTLGPLRALGLGVLLGFRPKNLLLATVVGLQLHTELHTTTSTAAAVIVYVVIATSTVTVPILASLVAPDRMEPRLASASELLSTDGPIISAVVLLMIGVVVIGVGLQTLT